MTVIFISNVKLKIKCYLIVPSMRIDLHSVIYIDSAFIIRWNSASVPSGKNRMVSTCSTEVTFPILSALNCLMSEVLKGPK